MPIFNIVLVLFVLFSAACSPGGSMTEVPETDEPSYRRGKQELRSNRNEEAMDAFLKVIEKRNSQKLSSPESHFEVGRLYLEYLKDPIYAIFFLREYLRLMPDSQHIDSVQAMIGTAQKEFARTLPGKPYNDAIDRLDLMDLLKQVRAENLELKRRLATARSQVTGITGGAFNQAQAVKRNDPGIYTPPSQVQSVKPQERGSVPTTYKVQHGDSLYRISAKVYGTGKYWKKIFEYNKGTLPSATALQPGMMLDIPPSP